MSVEENLTHADGSRVTVLSSVSPLEDNEGRAFGTLGIFHDVTDLKRAQAHATGLAQLIRESPSEIYIFDAESFGIVEANMGVCDNLGYTRNELLTMTPMDFSEGIDEYELRNTLNEAIDNDTLKCCFNAYHARRDGTSYPVQIDAHWAAFENKWVYVAFVKDLTEHQALQRQLTQAQKLESMGHMAAGIAHEINTPMQCVSGNVEFLMSSYDRLFKLTDHLVNLARDPQLRPDERAEQVERILEESRYHRIQENTPDAIRDASVAVQRVIEIVRAMKSMAHPGHKDCAEMDINDLLEKASVITRNRWKYVAELELDLDTNLPSVQGFPAELSQVFTNILVNAADAIAESVNRGDTGTIRAITRCTGGQVQISVQDTGCGMDEQTTHRVFDQFFTTKDVGKGTGLGLALSYDIVHNKHHGHIDVRSEVGVGTTFLITLPIRQPESKRPTPPADTGSLTTTAADAVFPLQTS
ncbi:MAG TPA: hypothetical protein DDW52_23715 [Planctomycetaceae bacterium]|nr:hypothetical protein [Planctomycetaceae bacterium]